VGMTIERMIELLKIERKCVNRKAETGCDRCEICDLVQDDGELNEMYAGVIAMLETRFCDNAVSRLDVLDGINAANSSGGFTDYSDYVQLFNFVDTMPSVMVV